MPVFIKKDAYFDSNNRYHCPACCYEIAVIIRNPLWHVHHAMARCARCDRFFRWLPKPENAWKRRRQAARKAARSRMMGGVR